MKTLKIAICIALGLSLVYLSSCAPSSAKTTEFKVWGNCGMCKETIEGSLKTDGVIEANWNKDTKMIRVKYDTLMINLDDIHKQIAGVGYDTEKMKGDDTAYANLHECCQYKRKE
ncbi:MAG: heavy-metal-associated domain-containing protein [Bacteroidia bacterium]|nr:heavy-metal-associated domain-containing protein [Bacteroidia bacterium]